MLGSYINALGDIAPERRSTPNRANVFHWAVLTVCTLALLGAFLLCEDGNGLGLLGIEWPLSCALYQNLGVKCALCGLTRSFCSIARADFWEAMQFHPLGPAVFVFVCLQAAYRVRMLQIVGKANSKLRLAGIYSALVLAGALLINWFVYLGGLTP